MRKPAENVSCNRAGGDYALYLAIIPVTAMNCRFRLKDERVHSLYTVFWRIIMIMIIKYNVLVARKAFLL